MSSNTTKTNQNHSPFSVGATPKAIGFCGGNSLFVEQRSTANYYTPYKFSGKEKDEETSYSYFGARYYMSDVSVWLSVDPLADQAPGWTPYRYCFQNPIRLIDPNGMEEGLPDWVEGRDKNGNPQIYWVNGPSDVKSGDKYLGKETSEYQENGTLTNYKADGTIENGKVLLPACEVTHKMNDHERAIYAGTKLGIYKAQNAFWRTGLEITSDATGKVGLGAQAIGVGLVLFPPTAAIGAGLIGVGNGLSRISSTVDLALDITDGNKTKIAIDIVGLTSGSGIKNGVNKLKATGLEKLYLKTVGGIILSTSEMGADKVIDKKMNKK